MNADDKGLTPEAKFLDSLIAELSAMSDEEVLGADDAEAIKVAGQQTYRRAKAAAGRRRLAMAKTNMEQLSSLRSESVSSDVTVAEARKFLVNASNDERYTLAARNLEDMSDTAVLSLYAQLKSLETKKGSD